MRGEKSDWSGIRCGVYLDQDRVDYRGQERRQDAKKDQFAYRGPNQEHLPPRHSLELNPNP